MAYIYGLYSYGLYSYGLYSDDIYSYGLFSYGQQSLQIPHAKSSVQFVVLMAFTDDQCSVNPLLSSGPRPQRVPPLSPPSHEPMWL